MSDITGSWFEYCMTYIEIQPLQIIWIMWTDAWSHIVSSIRWKSPLKMHIANNKMKHSFLYVKFIFVSVYSLSVLPLSIPFHLQRICLFINISLSLCSASCARYLARHPCCARPQSCPSVWPGSKRCLKDPMSLVSSWTMCRLWWHSTPPILSTIPILSLNLSVCPGC